MEKLPHPFSDRAKAVLESKKYPVYALTGKRLCDFGSDIIESGWHRYNRYFPFEATDSIRSEVSFDPQRFAIPLSHSQPFSVQLQMIREYGNWIEKQIPEIKVYLGNVTDYVELYRVHLRRKPQEKLLDKLQSIRTSTRIFELGVIYLGPQNSSTTLYIDHGEASHREGHIYIAPLIVPTDLLTNDPQIGYATLA